MTIVVNGEFCKSLISIMVLGILGAAVLTHAEPIKLSQVVYITRSKACGYAACMAYAAALREGEIGLTDCPPLWEDKYREKREKLQVYLESFGWRALDAE